MADSPLPVVACEGSPFLAGGRVRAAPGQALHARSMLLAELP